MTNAAHTNDTDTFKSHLLDIKRHLEKAQIEVDIGNPEIGLERINLALDSVYAALGLPRDHRA